MGTRPPPPLEVPPLDAALPELALVETVPELPLEPVVPELVLETPLDPVEAPELPVDEVEAPLVLETPFDDAEPPFEDPDWPPVSPPELVEPPPSPPSPAWNAWPPQAQTMKTGINAPAPRLTAVRIRIAPS